MLIRLVLLLFSSLTGCDCGASSHVRPDAGRDGGPPRDWEGMAPADAFVPRPCDDPAGGPRPIAPLSTARVASRRPQLWFDPPVGGGETMVRICADRECAVVLESLTTFEPFVRTSSLMPGVYYWQPHGIDIDGCARSGPVWQLVVTGVDSPVLTSWGHMSDYDGDGAADVGVASVETGTAEVIFGPDLMRRFPVLPNPAWREPSMEAPRPIGDVDGDGYADAVVVAQTAIGRRIQAYRGGPMGLDLGRDLTELFAPAGDLDRLGIAAVGDTDRDGYGDIAGFVSPGPIVVLRGGFGATAFSEERRIILPAEDEEGSIYAQFVAAGDVDGDGCSDMITSADYGRLVIFHGCGFPEFRRVTRRTSPLVLFVGTAVAAADVNGDGFSDVVLGGGNGDPTAAFLYRGSELGIAEMPEVIPWGPDGSYEWHGLLGAGDIDGDGREDVVGLGGNRPDAAAVYVLLGGDTPTRLSEPEPIQLVTLTAAGPIAGDANPDFTTAVTNDLDPTDGLDHIRTEVWLGLESSARFE